MAKKTKYLLHVQPVSLMAAEVFESEELSFDSEEELLKVQEQIRTYALQFGAPSDLIIRLDNAVMYFGAHQAKYLVFMVETEIIRGEDYVTA